MASFLRWSHSSLQTLSRCSHMFYLKYIMKNYRDGGPAMKRGIACHHVAKEGHKRQMSIMDLWKGSEPEMGEEPGSEKSVEEAKDIAASAFEREWSKGVRLNEKELALGKDLVKANAKDVTIDISGFYIGMVAPSVNPVAVERKIDAPSKELGVTLVGYLDLIEDADGNEYIRDLKSAEKAPGNFEVDEALSDDTVKIGRSESADLSTQLTIYTLLRYADTRKVPEGQKLVTVARTPAGNMKAYVAETSRNKEDLALLGRRLRVAIEAVDKGAFIPADPSIPGSPCSWCDFNDGTCEYFRRGGTPAIVPVQAELPK